MHSNKHEFLFQRLEGCWHLNRQVYTLNSNLPSGTFLGKVSLAPSFSSNPRYKQAYGYRESGHFTTPQGITTYSEQVYIYRLEDHPSQISIWKIDNYENPIEECLHKLDIIEIKIGTTSEYQFTLHGTPHHCKRDCYNVNYIFNFSDTRLQHWRSIYTVTGPKKNYQIYNDYYRYTPQN